MNGNFLKIMSGRRTNRAMGRVRPERQALRAHAALVYLFLYGPIAVLVVLSFNESGLPTAWGGFSTRWYAALADAADIHRAVLNTLIVAVSATAVATVPRHPAGPRARAPEAPQPGSTASCSCR